jgi:hypothetical protein
MAVCCGRRRRHQRDQQRRHGKGEYDEPELSVPWKFMPSPLIGEGRMPCLHRVENTRQAARIRRPSAALPSKAQTRLDSPSASTLWPRRVGMQASVGISWRAAPARCARPKRGTAARCDEGSSLDAPLMTGRSLPRWTNLSSGSERLEHHWTAAYFRVSGGKRARWIRRRGALFARRLSVVSHAA